ncbi:MAG TPA: DUF1553 domain-containing protein [Bryobacteraceae bacterium]|nr:DUF1553 domain-containing protein [Bryobacteraceae bacterium]
MSKFVFGVLSAAVLLGQPVEFNREIRPILSDRCFACHGPDAGNRKSALRLDSEAEAKKDLGRGRFGIVPGDAAKSLVYQRITSTNKALRMPPQYAGHAALPEASIAVIKRWIEQGAPWQAHWSFVPPVRPPGPHAIDSFIRERLAREGLKPAPPAAPETLLRRAYLDLTGLPPAPAEVDAFLRDPSPAAYEKVVDKLLASSAHAERMALRWLDAARYADTNGYQSDGPRDMWRWRDWVIEAYKQNMPFDKFTVEQIAGDLLPNATLSQRIATGFHRNHRTNAEGGIVEEEFRVEYVADRVETTSTVWLGLTMGCTRCHDHKYDPLRQKDFYSMFAFFNNVPERGLVYNFGNDEPMIKAPTPEMAAKLAGFDQALASAEADWDGRQTLLGKQQRAWEKKIRKGADDWSIRKGLVYANDGKRLSFDGKTPYDAGDKGKFNYMTPYSFSVWIKPESETGAILSRIEDYWEGEGYGLYVKNGNIHFVATRRYTDISLRLETAEKVKLGAWQHIAFTYDGNRKGKGVRIWIDGKPATIKTTFDELTYPFGPKVPFLIGGGGGLRFQGEIEDVRVFDRALTGEEALSTYVREPLAALARIAPAQRTPAQNAKLHLAFLDTAMSKEGRASLEARDAAKAARDKYYAVIPTVMVMEEGPKRQAYILKRGAYDAHGDPVEPNTPALLPAMKPEWPKNRLGLAYWLVDRSNPLTARVQVNRLWQMFFGQGLVKTVEDFGSQGEWPVHLGLLDSLAVEFMESGWNLQAIEKQIVMSETYRQSSAASAELWQRDPENRLLARGPRVRLAAPFVRDQALAASGLLVDKTGGPSVKPYQPPGLWQELGGGGGYKEDKGEGLYRRSLYTFWKRTVAPPMMINFDAPTREGCIVRETRTNTPLQALNLMNDVAFLEAARKMGERMMREGGSVPAERVAYGWKLVLGRAPKQRENDALLRAYERFLMRFGADLHAAAAYLKQGEAPRDPSLPVAELAASSAVANLILNLDEAVTKE